MKGAFIALLPAFNYSIFRLRKIPIMRTLFRSKEGKGSEDDGVARGGCSRVPILPSNSTQLCFHFRLGFGYTFVFMSRVYSGLKTLFRLLATLMYLHNEDGEEKISRFVYE